MFKRWTKTKRRVVAYCTTDDIFEGLLVGSYKDGVLLHGTVVKSDAKDVVLGTVFIPHDKLKFLQEV